MKDLLPILNQGADFLVDSRDVAKAFKIQHKNFREVVEQHERELTRLGVYRFETAKPLPGSEHRRREKPVAKRGSAWEGMKRWLAEVHGDERFWGQRNSARTKFNALFRK